MADIEVSWADALHRLILIVAKSLPAPIPEADFAAIVDQINSQLTPAIEDVFAAIATFPSGSTFSSLIRQDGVTLRADVVAFYNALGIAPPVRTTLGLGR